MNEDQAKAFTDFMRRHPDSEIIEFPAIMDNEAFGPTAYFTLRYAKSYSEHGIKPDGEIFTVR